jgi:lysophospholipase L1-like esterase
VVTGVACYITESGYAEALEDRREDVDATNAACAGATAALVPAQIQAAVFAGRLGEDTELVTITAGGNDVDFTAVIDACKTGVDTCEAAVESAVDVAENQVARALADDYALIRDAAPHATIAALGYPHLFSTKRGSESPLSPAAARVFNRGVDRLNKIIKQSAKSVPGTVYVDVTKNFRGHEVGSSDPWIYFNPLDDEDLYNFHPNAEGYEKGYAKALNRVVHSSQH